MSKEKSNIPFSDFIVVGHVEKKGRVIAMDILMSKGGKNYTITVGTDEYIKDLSGGSQDKNALIYPVDDTTDVSTLRQKIMQAPLEEIGSFLLPQEEARMGNKTLGLFDVVRKFVPGKRNKY